jgi:hypothetical protein
MAAYKPTSNSEWDYLTRRFPVLYRAPHARAILDNSLPGSDYTPQERRAFRREIFEIIRAHPNSPLDSFQNPYFELTWIRAVAQKPALLDNPTRNRVLLWNAFFRPEEPSDLREQQINAWKEASGELESLPIVTDRELELSE